MNRVSLLTLAIVFTAMACNQKPTGTEAPPAEQAQTAPALRLAPPPAPADEVGVPEVTGASGAPSVFDRKPAVGTRARCPVMGGEFVVGENTDVSEYGGKFYAFCCLGCKPQFDADPDKYVTKLASASGCPHGKVCEGKCPHGKVCEGKCPHATAAGKYGCGKTDCTHHGAEEPGDDDPE
jgi:YHS domain-containing protein